MNIIAITVSTNYADILSVIIGHNKQFFHKWYIITDKNDTNTIDLVNSHNTKGCEGKFVLLYYEFKNNGSTFDKGGAIKMAQQKVYEEYTTVNEKMLILLLDSDIYLQDDFISSIKDVDFVPHTIYGPEDRLNCTTYHNFNNRIINSSTSSRMDTNPAWSFAGFFQMYVLDDTLFYENSYNCAICDEKFVTCFTNKHVLKNVNVYHLGLDANGWFDTNNWNGRLKQDFLDLS